MSTDLIFNSKESAFEQTLRLDSFYETIDLTNGDPQQVVEVLLNYYKNGANNYIKRSAVVILCDLTMSEVVTNEYHALGVLKDLCTNENDPFLLKTALKYLFFISESQNSIPEAKLIEFADSSHGDVASEALFWMGFQKLTTFAAYNDTLSITTVLSESKRFFIASNEASENRVDAQYYIQIIDFLECAILNDPDLNSRFESIRKTFLTRLMYEFEFKNVELDILCFEILKHIQTKTQLLGTSGVWLDFKEAINGLFTVQNEIDKILVVKGGNSRIVNRIYDRSLSEVIKISYKLNLTNEFKRLERLQMDEHNPSQFSDFLTYILSQVIPLEKNSISDNPKLLLFLTNCYGQEHGLAYYNEIIDKSSIEEIINKGHKYNSSKLLPTNSFVGGYIQTEEVYNTIKSQLHPILTSMPIEKTSVFLRVLEEVIRYTMRTYVDSSKSDFPFLYSKSAGGLGTDAIERDLHDSMHLIMKLTSIADGFDYEKSRFMDGSRVDLVYKTSIITIPIELKKTNVSFTLKDIEAKYIEQSQTYVSGYDQVGIFVLLDLTNKKNKAFLNFRDLFNVHHIQPDTHLPVRHPDYVVSVIIPGNKSLPSEKSTY